MFLVKMSAPSENIEGICLGGRHVQSQQTFFRLLLIGLSFENCFLSMKKGGEEDSAECENREIQ